MNSAFTFLQKSHQQGRLVHAYLFFGGNQHDAVETAKGFAKLVLTADETTSRLIDAESCANVITIRPDGKNIKKEQIVFLKGEIAKKSVENRAKIYIIEDADKMSLTAANSLLKFLEEPAPDVYIILITPSREVLLPTLVSRCVGLSFKSNVETTAIDHDFLTIIGQIELGEPFHMLVAGNSEIFKERTSDFLTALSRFYHREIDRALNSPLQLQRCTKRIRAILEAQRNLRYNMNVQLCLDKLALDFNS